MDKSKIIVCRCEDVTLEDVERCIEAGMTSADEIKRYLKCTMGTCQGRGCFSIIDALLAKKAKDGRKPSSIRPPLIPLDIKYLPEDE